MATVPAARDSASLLMYPRVFATFARNSLVRDMTFRWNFIIESLSSLSWMLMNLGFYVLIFRYTDEIGAGHRLGQVSVLRLSLDHAVHQQRGAGLLHAQRRRVQRADPHRRARFRAAQADRHAVSDLAAKGRMVERCRISCLPAACWFIRWCSSITCPALLQIVLYPAISAVRRGDAVQPDDRAGGDQRLAGAESEPVRLLVLHHQFLPLSDGDLSRPDRHPLQWVFTFWSRCWWW